MSGCIRVAKQRNAPENDIITIPIQEDGTILRKDISAETFPSAMGLIRYGDAHNFVVISLNNDVLYPPNEEWGNDLYVIMIPNDKGHWTGSTEKNSKSPGIGTKIKWLSSRFSSDKLTNVANNVLKLTNNTMGRKSDTLAMCSRLDKKSIRLSWQKFWEERTEKFWPEKCCFKDCTSKLKPLNNAGLYEIKEHPNKLVTIPACNECKFNSEDFRHLCKTRAVMVTEEDMLDFSASNLAKLKVYEIKGNTKVKKTNKKTNKDACSTAITTWKRGTENDILPPVCSFEDCKKEPNKVAYVNIQGMKTQLFIILTCGCSSCNSGRSIGWEPVRKGTLAVLTEEDNTEEPNEDRVQEKQSP